MWQIMGNRSCLTKRRTLLLLISAFVLLPVCIVHLIPTDSPESYVFRAGVSEFLRQSTNGQLQYFEADVVQGAAPGSRIVLALDGSYSRGYQMATAQVGLTAWFQGSLMTPEVFYGEQYLFFDLPQVYVRQVKTGLLWPDQWSGLRVLYLSPLETLAAPLQIPFLIRSDSFTYEALAVLLARCGLIATTLWLTVGKRLKGSRLQVALLAYAVIAVVLTVPILADMY